MGRFKTWLVDFILNRTPVVSDLLKFLDGHKTAVGRWGTLISSILVIAVQLWPGQPALAQALSVAMMIISWLFEQLGLEHKILKGELVKPEIKEAAEAAS